LTALLEPCPVGVGWVSVSDSNFLMSISCLPPQVEPKDQWAATGRKQKVAAMMEESVEDIDWDMLLVKGTSESLEKSYFRLTSAPDPSTVRPEPVLEQALARLVKLIRSRSVSYFYLEDQFKGMRQDCTVQHLRSELTARIYEAHARAALEYGDFAGYNQVLGATNGLRYSLCFSPPCQTKKVDCQQEHR
jgi:SAC3/GANP family